MLSFYIYYLFSIFLNIIIFILLRHPAHVEAITAAVKSEQHNGYLPSHGNIVICKCMRSTNWMFLTFLFCLSLKHAIPISIILLWSTNSSPIPFLAGSVAARAAIARVSSYPGAAPVTADSVCIASGCRCFSRVAELLWT